MYFPNLLEWYVIAALPVAFAIAALIGMALERSVIRLLYGRPLETLLATWGISLILIRPCARLRRAERGGRESAWMSGGIE